MSLCRSESFGKENYYRAVGVAEGTEGGGVSNKGSGLYGKKMARNLAACLSSARYGGN